MCKSSTQLQMVEELMALKLLLIHPFRGRNSKILWLCLWKTWFSFQQEHHQWGKMATINLSNRGFTYWLFQETRVTLVFKTIPINPDMPNVCWSSFSYPVRQTLINILNMLLHWRSGSHWIDEVHRQRLSNPLTSYDVSVLTCFFFFYPQSLVPKFSHKKKNPHNVSIMRFGLWSEMANGD